MRGLTLCTQQDYADQRLEALPVCPTEADTDLVVTSVYCFFKRILDNRPYGQFGFLTPRAENILRRERAVTIRDVMDCYLKAHAGGGMPGVGKLVLMEWRALLSKAGRA